MERSLPLRHCLLLSLLLLLLLSPSPSLAKRVRSRHLLLKPDIEQRPPGGCIDPPDLKEQLAEWLSETAEGTPGADWSPKSEDDDDWAPPPTGADAICDAPLDTGTDSNVMQRSLCPWTWKVSFDEGREPRMLSEATCMCRRSRGTSGSYCMPIKRETPVLRRGKCNPLTGFYEYSRATISTTVGCHSVLPRTQRTYKLSKLHSDVGIEI